MTNQQDIPYIAGPKQEGMSFSGMIKSKLNFFKNMQNKIIKSIFYFPFILELKRKKKKDYMTQKQFNSERRKTKKEKGGRKKKR